MSKANPQLKMSTAFQKRTRTIYTDQINNSRSIRADETIVPALIKGISSDKTKTGNNPGTVYYRLKVVCMNKEPTFVRFKVKKKKGDVDGDGDAKRQRTDGDGEDDGDGEATPKGTVVNGGDEFSVTTYDKAAGTLDSGTLANLAMTTDWYNERFTFSAGSVIVDNKMSNALCDKVYNDMVINTKMAEIPTAANMSEADFPEETDEKWMSRSFIVPLSVDNSKFANVEIQVDEEDTGRFFCKVKDSDAQLVGVNMVVGDKTANMFKVVYSPKDEDEPKIMMSLAYVPETWRCFGITDLDVWQKVGHRFMFNAAEWYAYGYTQLTRLNGIIANKNPDGGDDEDPFEYSTGFVTKMATNLKATIQRVGVPLSVEYIMENYGEDSDYDREHEVENHPTNTGFRINIKRNKAFITNLTELSTIQVEAFFKDYTKCLKDKGPDKFNVQFYGVFQSDDVYEFAADDEESREAFVVEKGHKPVAVFAINK